MLGIHLEIEQSGGDGSARAERQQHDEETAAVRAEQAADDAPEHRSIGDAPVRHHSPRRMGAGS